jgi:hypothetical protein
MIFRFFLLLVFFSSATHLDQDRKQGEDQHQPFSPVNRDSVIAQFPALLPLAVSWAAAEEGRILEQGVALTPREIDDAKAVGVREPNAVRLATEFAFELIVGASARWLFTSWFILRSMSGSAVSSLFCGSIWPNA